MTAIKITEKNRGRHLDTLYPYLPELISIIAKNGMTSFLVTNGAHPEMIQKLLGKKEFQPTNLYVTLHAPDTQSFTKEVCPMIPDGWERLMKTLALLPRFPETTKTIIRLTLNKKITMRAPETYAHIIMKTRPRFVECKAYMAIGGSTLAYEDMPLFDEIRDFAYKIAAYSDYHIIQEDVPSRVVLLAHT